MKIALVGLYYPMAILRYFENALKRREDIELVTVGPYTGNWIPWNGGMSVLPKYAKSPTIALPKDLIGVRKISPDILKMYPQIADVDVWIEVDAGFYLDPKPPGLVIHIATDPHVLDYTRQRELADYFFCMQTPYMKPNDYYLPYAYDPGSHYPMDVKKEFDACLIGLHYPNRDRWVRILKESGLNVKYDIGPMFDEYRELHNKSKIGLNWSSLDDLVARIWEIAAMGLPMVTNRVTDLPTFFEEGVDYLGFDTMDEAVRSVMEIYKNPEIGKHLGENALNKVKDIHTYDARIDEVFEIAGLK